MLKHTSLEFLTKLKQNNSKDWFENHRDLYDNYRNDVLQLTETLLNEVAKFDRSISLAGLDPKKCTTRVYRDLRFSKDKTHPYKDYVLIVLNFKGFHGDVSAGYYLYIEPGGSYLGGGIFRTEPNILKKIRQKIDYSFDEFDTIITTSKFKKIYPNGIQGPGKLKIMPDKKLPEGSDKRQNLGELLKLKGYCTKEFINDQILTSEDCVETIVEYFKTTKPLIDFINKAAESKE